MTRCHDLSFLNVRFTPAFSLSSFTFIKSLFSSSLLSSISVLHSVCQQIWKTQQWPQDWKMSVFIPIPKKDNAKDYSKYHTILFISQSIKVMLKILQARLQQYMNPELPDVQAGFRKDRGTRDQIANICWSLKKQESSRKQSIFPLLIMLKLLNVWTTTNWRKFLKKWGS